MNAPSLAPKGPSLGGQPKTPVSKMGQPRLRTIKRLLMKPQGGMKTFGR